MNQTAERRVQADNLETFLPPSLRRLMTLSVKLIPDPQVINLFRKRYDYLNAKLILKAEALKLEVRETLSELGTIEPGKLLKSISGRKLSDLPEIFSEAITESLEV
jgi:V/A-type H+-transporting ATPase subunit C